MNKKAAASRAVIEKQLASLRAGDPPDLASVLEAMLLMVDAIEAGSAESASVIRTALKNTKRFS